jgi:hypothetical protein
MSNSNSFGYAGVVSSEVNAHLRVDMSGVRCTLISDADFSIQAGKRRKITYTMMVPKNVGFVQINWASDLQNSETPAIDYVGSAGVNGDVVNAVNVAGSFTDGTPLLSTDPVDLVYAGSAIAVAAVGGYAATDLFNKFNISYYLINNTASAAACVQLITGFSYNCSNVPRTKGTQFKIFANVNIGSEL